MNVDGMVAGCHLPAMLLSLSHKRGNLAPLVAPNSATPLFSSSSLTPTISKPAVPYFTRSSSSLGKDFLHGLHHVAQKSTTTTFPFHCASAIFPLPLIESPEKSGPGLLRSSCFPPFGTAGPPPSLPPPPHAITVTANATDLTTPEFFMASEGTRVVWRVRASATSWPSRTSVRMRSCRTFPSDT